MTRGQYLAMCCIGLVAMVAFVRVIDLQRKMSGGSGLLPNNKPLLI